MDQRLERILPRVQKPARYTGGEYNAVIKDKAEINIRFALCFPDTYEIGMSNLGCRILYGVMNQEPDIWCERSFAPWGDMEAEMRKAEIPLYALESGDPLAQFDAITKIAAEGPGVIVGRCADYVLKDRPGVTHIFIYASEERRIARIMRVEKVDREHARELIRKTDRQRRSYYNFFADGNWGMRSNYDLMLRTDGRRPEDVADIIIAFAKMRADG